MKISRAGFVLVGGDSRRMGSDKALLPWRGATLAQYVAGEVAAAAGTAVLVGDPVKYGGLGYAVVRDLAPGTGPLGGICSALRSSSAEWNLVVACDMPGVTATFLTRLLEAAAASGADCLVPAGPEGRPEPLCAVYHARALPAIAAALARGVRKVTDGLRDTRISVFPVEERQVFENCNTREEWAAHSDKTRRGAV